MAFADVLLAVGPEGATGFPREEEGGLAKTPSPLPGVKVCRDRGGVEVEEEEEGLEEPGDDVTVAGIDPKSEDEGAKASVVSMPVVSMTVPGGKSWLPAPP